MNKVNFFYPAAIGGLAAIIGAYGSQNVLWPLITGVLISGLTSLFLIESEHSPFPPGEKLKTYSPAGAAGGLAGGLVASNGFTEAGYTGVLTGLASGWLIGLLVPAIGAIALKEESDDEDA